MSRGAHKFKQGDVTKAIKGAVNAGLAVKRAVVRTDGSIVLDFTRQDNQSGPDGEWDDVQ